MTTDAPKGLRFSHVYLSRSDPAGDSPRMRQRLFTYFNQYLDVPRISFATVLRQELGVALRSIGHRFDYSAFFKDAELRDVLDAITLIYILVCGDGQRARADEVAMAWLKFVARVFEEENLHYRVDEQGGVHLSIDQEFEAIRVAAIKSLGKARYSEALKAFDLAHNALDATPPDGRIAIGSVFDAMETAFKLACEPKTPARLGAKEIQDNLGPVIQSVFASDPTAKNAASKLLGSFKEWTDGAHFYRHANKTEQSNQPPLEFAILLVSTGASFLRWLIELDGRTR